MHIAPSNTKHHPAAYGIERPMPWSKRSKRSKPTLGIPCALVLSSHMVHVETRRGATAGAAEVLLRQAREAQKLQRFCAFEVWFFYA
jgi:hypothetical protein